MDSPHPTLLRRLQKLEDYIFFSVVAAALGLAALSAYILVNRAALKLQEAWAAPVAFLVVGAVLLGLAWQRQNVKRALAGLPVAAPAAPPAPVPLGLRLLLGAAAFGYLALFALVTGVALRAVYNNNHFAGLVFGIIYALLTALELLAASGLRGGAAANMDLWSLLLPGGLHLARMGAFWLGFAVPLITMGLQAGQLPQVNALFQRNKPWVLLKDVPDAAVLGLGLLYFILLEGLLGQAGGAWERLNRGEPVLPNKWAVVARWVLALALAYPLGGLPLLVMAALLVLWQALVFGRGADWPQRRPGPALMLLALGPALLYSGRDAHLAGQPVELRRAAGAAARGLLPGAGACRRAVAGPICGLPACPRPGGCPGRSRPAAQPVFPDAHPPLAVHRVCRGGLCQPAGAGAAHPGGELPLLQFDPLAQFCALHPHRRRAHGLF